MGKTEVSRRPYRFGEYWTDEEVLVSLGLKPNARSTTFVYRKGGTILGARLNQEHNPYAPYEVLLAPDLKPANHIEKQGHLAAEQLDAKIPVWLYRGTNKWECQGMWRIAGVDQRPEVIKARASEAGREGGVGIIVYLTPVTTEDAPPTP